MLTFSLPGNKEMIEVGDDLPGVVVGVLQHRPGHADLGVGEEGGEPLAVNVDAVPDDHVVLQREAEAVADDLHHPVDLLLAAEDAGPGLCRDRDPKVLGDCVHNTGNNLHITQILAHLSLMQRSSGLESHHCPPLITCHQPVFHPLAAASSGLTGWPCPGSAAAL